MPTTSTSSPPTSVPQENIAAAATVLRSELGRSDTKASVLLGLTGAALLGTASTALDGGSPLGAAVLRCLGVAGFFAATVFLLLAVFPSLAGSGWPAWRQLSTDELRIRLTAGQHQVEEVHVLVLSAARKFRRIQYAVICDLAGLGFTAAAAVLAGAL